MREVPLTKGRVALVDDSDYEWITQWKWHLSEKSGGYSIAARNGKKVNGKRTSYIKMHRLIMGVTDPKILVDHRDKNPLNNQRKNLRLCSKSQNAMNSKRPRTNTSGYKGVFWHDGDKNWAAAIMLNQKPKYLGGFKTPEMAARAYDAAARNLFGEFASLNFQEPTCV